MLNSFKARCVILYFGSIDFINKLHSAIFSASVTSTNADSQPVQASQRNLFYILPLQHTIKTGYIVDFREHLYQSNKRICRRFGKCNEKLDQYFLCTF